VSQLDLALADALRLKQI